MEHIRAIRTEEDVDAALSRIQELLDELSSADGQIEAVDHPARVALDVLTDLVEHYESKTVEIGYLDPIAAIEFRMDQAGLTPRNLVPFIGSRSKVSEVLSGKRAITMSMARALHQHLGIPADILLQEQRGARPQSPTSIEWTRFPLRAMATAGLIPDVPQIKQHAEELVSNLMRRAGNPTPVGAMLYRKNDRRRINAKTDEYALQAWCWQVMATAQERTPPVAYAPGCITAGFLREVARLSSAEDGPSQARDLLARHGIGFEVVPHLPKTYLDGAAFLLAGARPVVGLTLRYDRIDHFWFTLLHELAHVSLHLEDGDDETAFVDDLSLRGMEAGGGDSKEAQADRLAEESLIPGDVWEAAPVRTNPSAMRVMSLAQTLGVHPAIVAGRIRHEHGNYRLLSQFVGTGEVRGQFAGEDEHEGRSFNAVGERRAD